MKEINIRQFNRNLYKELAKLPLVVTRNGKPLFKCVLIEDVTTIPDVTTYKPKIVTTSNKAKVVGSLPDVNSITLCSYPFCSNLAVSNGRCNEHK
jgi:hypothetical protein